MCFFSAIFEWVSSNVSTVATMVSMVAAIAAAIAAGVAAFQLRESRRATQLQVFDATFNKLRELGENYYTKNPAVDSKEEKHWLDGLFNTFEYMSFLANAGFIPRKPFTRFYGDAIIEFYETIFLNKAEDEQRNEPQQFSEFKRLYKRLKRKTGKPIWEKRSFR